jgi:branched-chain amino acid transport system permease protein
VSDTAVRTIFDILSVTSVLVLLVIGMAVIVGLMKVFNMCQGELVLLGAITAYITYTVLGSMLLGILLAPIVVGLFGLLLERAVIHRFYTNPQGALLATFAIGLIIREVLRSRMTNQSAFVPAPLPESIDVLGAQLPVWRIIIIVVTIVLVLACGLLLLKTNLGLKVRATLDNPALVSASGVSTKWMYAGTYAFGSALAGFAGAMIVPLQTLYPNLGFDNVVMMFISVMVGGLGTFAGPVVGAVAISVPGSILATIISPVTAQILIVLVAIVFMRFRPNGLLRRDS